MSLAAVQGELTALTDRVPGPGPADPGVRHHVVLAALLDQLGAPDHHRELVGERQGQQDQEEEEDPGNRVVPLMSVQTEKKKKIFFPIRRCHWINGIVTAELDRVLSKNVRNTDIT